MSLLSEIYGLKKPTKKLQTEFVHPEILLERMDFLQIAKGIVRAYKLKSKVVFKDRKSVV